MTSQLEFLAALLGHYQPSPLPLRQAVNRCITKKQLYSIAQADYGWKADECHETLQQMIKPQLMVNVGPYVHEVLELTRWSEQTDRMGHQKRLFACTHLLLIAHGPIGCIGENQTLAQLLDSVHFLGKNWYKAAIQLLAWRLLEDEKNADFYQSETAFFAYALLLLLLWQQAPDEQISPLFNCLLSMEKRQRSFDNFHPAFLLGTENHDIKHELWQDLSARTADRIGYLPAIQQETLRGVFASVQTYGTESK